MMSSVLFGIEIAEVQARRWQHPRRTAIRQRARAGRLQRSCLGGPQQPGRSFMSQWRGSAAGRGAIAEFWHGSLSVLAASIPTAACLPDYCPTLNAHSQLALHALPNVKLSTRDAAKQAARPFITLDLVFPCACTDQIRSSHAVARAHSNPVFPADPPPLHIIRLTFLSLGHLRQHQRNL